jgi:adenine-specific DNA-methyltransferase
MTKPQAQTEPKAAALTSPDVQAERLAQLRRLMPDLFDGEGKLDEAALRALSNADGEAPVSERFRFEWAGKHQSKRFAFTPSRGTLVADKARSVDFESTQNLIIEGDNLEVLKLLQATYFERVKCIYIDPPYNTGNDFIYPDNFGESKKAYWMKNGTIKDGVKLSAVTESNGRRHSNWLNMMQARLLLARQLLRPDGVIFISIDDNEQANLKKLCDEVFGDENFISLFPWRKRTAKSDVPFGVSQDFEWVMAYAKGDFMAGQTITRRYHHTDDLEYGWRLSDLTKQSSKEERPNSFFDMVDPKTGKSYPANPNRVWAVSTDTFQEYYDKGKIVFPDDYDFLNIATPAYRVFDVEDAAKSLKKHGSEDAIKAISTLMPKDIGRTEDGTKELTELFGQKLFPFPKPTSLLRFFVDIINDDEAIIMDFFAGSGALAQAVMQANAADEGQRRYILVQIPEYTDEASAAYQAGYKTISALCIKRVELAGAKTRQEQPDAAIDTGFRVFRLTDSHFPENLFTPDPDKTDEENRAALEAHLNAPRQQNIFAEAVFEDAVTELAIKNGYGLFYTLERLDAFTANAVYRLSGNDKAALLCLDEALKEATLEQLEAHSDEQLFCSRRALDTTKKWTLQAAFKDNLWTV